MGCCSSRVRETSPSNHLKIVLYIENANLNSLLCDDIQQIYLDFKGISWKLVDYQRIAATYNINVPFDVLSIKGYIYKFELASGLILLSKDTFENKLKLFTRIATTDRLIMRFLEWRYQLVNERLPFELVRIKLLDFIEYKQWQQSSRISCGEFLLTSFKQIKSDNKVALINSLSV